MTTFNTISRHSVAKYAFVAVLVLMVAASSVSADTVTFDGGIPGTIFGQPVGTAPGTLLFSEDGTDVTITTLISSGAPSYNYCSIENSLPAPYNFHQNNIMFLQGVGLVFDFTGQGDVRFEYLHRGGTVNLQVNGYGAVIEDQTLGAMTGMLAPGIFMTATSTGVPNGIKGTVTITGPVQSLRIGGGELYLDQVIGGGDPDPLECNYAVNHQSLFLGTSWGLTSGENPGDVMFNQDAIPVSCETFYFSGSASTFGQCRVTTTPVSAFGHDKVMRCEDINNQYDIAALGIITEMVSFEFLNDGSLENLQVNGGTIFKNTFENMPATVAPGVTMTVTSYSTGSGTRGLVVLTGNIETLMVGGRVLYLDNLCITQGDLSHAGNSVNNISLQLHGSHPNPFNPRTTVSFSTQSNSLVLAQIFDIRGSLVKTLVDQNLEAGRHQFEWNGENSLGQRVATGGYLVEVRSGHEVQIQKITMIK